MTEGEFEMREWPKVSVVFIIYNCLQTLLQMQHIVAASIRRV
jgi:hypothetical protein